MMGVTNFRWTTTICCATCKNRIEDKYGDPQCRLEEDILPNSSEIYESLCDDYEADK